nr:cdc42 effector protein 1 isoform X1 [Pongo abelii]XP_054399367.1 cdc42 effector protein 1 isoform X1 [Pongo abelii]XP_054399368.1 cdc42 effector protein 1 isoform X1 [Pongo abelii]XP_054399369.1 cdc42 effector protein 1 isoform X1 [Pongo abelii]XP_054399370.1 cdc42 effector protein 1 isoform X1 [Pongo abelii]XP_054399371.1 cdc42 effector protein 1 isoform X1 [Pongo abelii]XP_054399372.1 cdc42 effector protein 1 isoform X1 [Pongo abelii]
MPGPQGGGGAPTMSLGKLSPVGWVSSSQGKRRLTADMISPPLGDFRHTMHVGRGGDVFGDTSFLSNHGGSSRGTHRSPRSFLAKKLQLVRRVGAPPRRMASPPAPSPAPPAISPIIKNAISLPQLNQAAYDSLVVGKLSFDSSPTSSTDGHSSYGLDSGFCTISRLPRSEKPHDRDRDSSFPSEPGLRRSDSLLSFRLDLDLGPSLLSELLGVMSLPEAPAAETPAPAANPPAPTANPTGPAANPPAPTANPPAPAANPSAPAATPTGPAANPPAPAASSTPHGHCPNGVTAGLGPVAEVKASPVGGGPRGPAGPALGRHWGAGWDGGHHYPEMDARQERVEVLPQARASLESLDEEWRVPQAGSRTPVPSTVQANTFEFADAEEDDEVKV